MKVTLLTAKNSRNAGGVLDSMKNLAITLLNYKECNINILSHNDEYSAEDISVYGNVPMPTYKISNFYPLKEIGYSKDILGALELLTPEIIDEQGIWKYHSKATLDYKKKYRNVKTIITPHGMLDPWLKKRSKLLKLILRLWYVNKSLNTTDCFHALNYSEYKSIREWGLKNPVAIIPNGTNIPQWQRDYTIKKEKKIMLFLGRIHPKKGIEEFITAIHLINKKHPQMLLGWRFIIAGWSQEGHLEHLKKLVEQFKLNDSFEFPGAIYGEEKEKTLKGADVFILPSHSEGMPMAVLEAWAFGLPVIMTEYCNIPEGFIADAAFKIDTDSEKMCGQLIQFFKLPNDQIIEIGKNGHKLAKENFSWNSVAKQNIHLYNWLLNKSEKPDFVITN